MKEQICLAIISLTLFCILVILIVCCSLMYEILIKDYEQKKLYFYNRYKDYIESTFYFQNFYMMQYEETIHHIQKQTWRLQQGSYIYGGLLPLKKITEYAPYIKNITSEIPHNFNRQQYQYKINTDTINNSNKNPQPKRTLNKVNSNSNLNASKNRYNNFEIKPRTREYATKTQVYSYNNGNASSGFCP